MVREVSRKQSHYIEVVQGTIFMEQNMIEIWADFWPVGNTEKIVLGRLRATFESSSFMSSGAKNKIKEYCSVHTKMFA